MRNYFTIEDIKKIADIKEPYVDILCEGVTFRIGMDVQKTGYGERTFLKCPRCGKRREKLYFINQTVRCRECFPKNVYSGIQHTTIGGTDYINYKMNRFAIKNGIDFKQHPFRYYEYEKPKYKNGDKWCDNLIIMQALANMRFQTIFCKKIWDKKTVDSILKWDNSLLYINDLYDMDRYNINWDFGVNMNTVFIKNNDVSKG